MKLVRLTESVDYDVPDDIDSIRRRFLNRVTPGKINGCKIVGTPVFMYKDPRNHFLVVLNGRKETSLCDFIVSDDGNYVWNDSYVMITPHRGGEVGVKLSAPGVYERFSSTEITAGNALDDFLYLIRRVDDGDRDIKSKISDLVNGYLNYRD